MWAYTCTSIHGYSYVCLHVWEVTRSCPRTQTNVMLPPPLLTCISSRLLRPPLTLLSSSHRWDQCQSFRLWISLGLTYKEKVKTSLGSVSSFSYLRSCASSSHVFLSGSPGTCSLGFDSVSSLKRFSSPQHTSQPYFAAFAALESSCCFPPFSLTLC